MKEEIQELIAKLEDSGLSEERAKEWVMDLMDQVYQAGFNQGTFVDSNWCKPYSRIRTNLESYLEHGEE